MKFRIDKADFLSAIATVSRALPARAASPILEGILVEASLELSRLRLLATNTALQIECFVPADVSFPGMIVLPGKLLYEVIRRQPDGEVELAILENRPNAVSIKSGKSRTSMQGFAADEFPELPPILPKGTFTLPQKSLRSMIAQTLFAVSTDETRPVLTGGLMEVENGVMTMVGLDGYRLALRREPVLYEADMTAIIPAAALSAIERILADEGDLTVTFSPAAALFDMNHTRITTVLLSGEYMKYKKIIPAEKLTTVRVDRTELMAAIDRASLMARDSKNNLVKFSIAPEVLTVTANSEIGDVVDEVPIALTGGELEIAFNAKYMTDVLKVLSEDEIVLEMNTNVSPCVIKPLSGDAWLYLVLPVRIFS